MVDTNVFIAAFKSGYTTTTELLLQLLTDEKVELIADEVLIKEYEKWFNIISAKIPEARNVATSLYNLILAKVRLVNPEPEHIEKVSKYVPATKKAEYLPCRRMP